MKEKSGNAIHTIKINLMGSASGMADRRMSQAFQLSLFTKVTSQEPSRTTLALSLCSVSAKYQLMSIPIIIGYI